MPIVLTDYDKLFECKGNKNNQIFVVQHVATRKKYVLKIIDHCIKGNQLREIEVHMKLNHKYVIRLVDYECRDTKILMLIEFAKHGDLYSFLPKIKEMEEYQILKMFYRLLKAIEYIHSNNFVHRDIKPENILITNNFRPKLADFGTSGSKNIIANTFCGTYEYMAPEVYLRCKQTDKVDVWAAGILLYELLHQKTPFMNDTLQSIKEKIELKTLYFNLEIQEDIKDFIYLALTFHFEERPSISELLNHKVFDGITSKERRKSTAATQLKNVCSSLKELGSSIKQSYQQNKKHYRNIKKKFPVHTEIFDTEHNNKNMKNFTNKIKAYKGMQAPKTVNTTKKPKNIIVNLHRPKFSQNAAVSKYKAFVNKKIKTLQEMPDKRSFREPVRPKKKLNVMMSLNNIESKLSIKYGTPIHKIKRPSLEMNIRTSSNLGKKIKNPSFNSKISINNIYERKSNFVGQPTRSKIK